MHGFKQRTLLSIWEHLHRNKEAEKLAKSVSESTAKTINRTSNVNQLPLQNLRDKFEQQHKDNLVSQGDEKSHQDEISQHSFRPDSTTKFDPKFLQKIK